MEGKVGNIFETQFRTTVRKNTSTPSVHPSVVALNPTDEFLKDEDDGLIPQETKNKHVNHMLRNSALVTGIGVVLLTPVVMLATKGKFPKPITNFLNKKANKIAEKIRVLKEKPEMTKAEMVYLNSLQKTSQTLNAVKGLALNTGPLKDVLFEKVLRTIGLGKVCNKVTGFFEKMAVKMTSIAYKKSSDSFALMKESFTQANKQMANSKGKSTVKEINGVSKTVEEWAKIAEEKTQHIDSLYDAFRPNAVNKRYKWIAKQFNGLGDKVYKETYGSLFKFIKSPKKWTSFITEDFAAPSKLKLTRTINAKKKDITNTSADVIKELESLVSHIESSLDMTSKSSVDILKRLKKVVGGYNVKDLNAKQEVLAEVTSIIHDSGKVLAEEASHYSIPTSRKIQKTLGNIKYVIESDKKGEVEELLSIYKHILPKEQFEQVKKAAQKSKLALDDAVVTESDKFVDKMRDLKSGAALTDVGIGLLVPFGSTAVGMSMADTKEKKRSVCLNLGVPLLVGLATSMIGTVAMLTAGPTLLLGLATSTLTNRICTKIDKNLKKRDAANLVQAQALLQSQNQVQKTTA